MCGVTGWKLEGAHHLDSCYNIMLKQAPPKIIAIYNYVYILYSYLIGASYGYFHSFHISTYGEAILLAMQSE